MLPLKAPPRLKALLRLRALHRLRALLRLKALEPGPVRVIDREITVGFRERIIL